MKRIILTEYQYKRLIKKNLNEQKIVFSNPKDEFDITNQMMQLLIHLEFFIDTIANKFLYIDKVENGIIYIDSVKYTKEEKDLINTEIDKWIVFTDSTRDKRSQDLTYNFGVDTDWDDRYPNEDIAVVDNDNNSATDDIDFDDNSDVTDDVDFEDDSTTEIDYDPTKKYSRTEYIALVKDNAIKQMKKHKIPASITIAQGIIESGDGNSGLARKGKNHFGIKCHSWTGEKIYLDTGEVNKDGSKRIDKNACFRKYDNISQSFDDHSKFLIDNSRYSSLFELGTTNYKGWAEGLQKAGYATSPTYANLVISIIEKNNLNKFDSNTNSLVVGCTFTSAELKYFNENIKNNEDNLNFRYWVNQDSNRLERVNKKLSDCGLRDPKLDKEGKMNNHLKIAFVLIGKDWVNAGKPKRPDEEEEEVVVDDVIYDSSELLTWSKRAKKDRDAGIINPTLISDRRYW
jgi:flagellum-specific peptidoglycan hydrolase FlgJ